VASALFCAHAAHVIHRDIKPPNILITEQGKAYVTDFGIAKILSMDDNLTVDGSRLGTPHYMSPERCKNGELTGSSDLYSLGVLLFQMLTGRLPYEAGSSVELIRSIVYNPPTRLRRFRGDLPDDVERLVAWMIEKQPKHRPVSGRTVCEAIQRVRQGRPLDTGGNPMITVLADFRQTFGKRTEPDTPIELPRKLASGLTPITEALPESWRRRIRFGAVLLAAFVVMFAGLAWFGGGSDTAVQAWDPELANPQRWFADAAVARFEDESPGVIRVTLNLPGFTIGSVAPISDSGAFLVELSGAKGSQHEGRSAICEVDPVQRDASIVSSVLPPRSTGDGHVESEIGEAQSVSWIPTGSALIGTAVDRKGFRQIWRFESTSPHRRTQLTHLDGGTSAACTLSSDGAWVASVRNSVTEPALVIASARAEGF
jgi:hypothetical protein